MKPTQHSTNVKIDKNLFESFKKESVTSFINFQKLCDRSLYLYLNNPEFKELILKTNETELL